MTETQSEYKGIWGTITQVPQAKGFEPKGDLVSWFLDAPAAHPIWPQYLFTVVHLRPLEGFPPPLKRVPNASHELLLIALNPERGPWTRENVIDKATHSSATQASHLIPPNIAIQISDATDDQAIELVRLLARGLVDGIVPIEPNDHVHGKARWADVVEMTLEHIKTGGHDRTDPLTEQTQPPLVLMQSGDLAPTNLQEYAVRYASNHRIEGMGMDTATVLPCPFCAAANFVRLPIVNTMQALEEGATCRECGRSCKAIFEITPESTKFEIVQSGGDAQPDWFEPKMRRVDDA